VCNQLDFQLNELLILQESNLRFQSLRFFQVKNQEENLSMAPKRKRSVLATSDKVVDDESKNKTLVLEKPAQVVSNTNNETALVHSSSSSSAAAASSSEDEQMMMDGEVDEVIARNERIAKAITVPYRPGCIYDHEEVLALAKRLEAHLDADFQDNEHTAASTSALDVTTDISSSSSSSSGTGTGGGGKYSLAIINRLEAELKANEEKAVDARSMHRLNPSDSTTEALVQIESTRKRIEAELKRTFKKRALRYRRNLLENILRVTLTDKASIANAAANAASNASSSLSNGSIQEGENEDGVLVTVGVDSGETVKTLNVSRITNVCINCGNNDESKFIDDQRQGDVICTECGAVCVEHAIHDGDWVRSFEGEETTSQVGPAPDPLLSNRANLRTSFGITLGVSKAKMRQMRLMSEAIEMGTSGAAGVSDKRTRVSYMDRQKVKASELLTSACERLDLPRPVLDRAKRYFAAFRDSRQHVTALNTTIASALLAAVEESLFYRLRYESKSVISSGSVSGVSISVSAGASNLSSGAAGGGESSQTTSSTSLIKKEPSRAELSISSQLPPPPPPSQLTKEEKEEIERKALQRAEREDKLARAMGLLGPSKMIYGDREAASSLPLSSSSSSAAIGDTVMKGDGKSSTQVLDDEEEDEDEAILRKIEEERRASRGRLIWSHKGIKNSSSTSSSSGDPPPPPPSS
jgi:hypothetical protein